jgi:glycosyltransferase involved in cell wall biosynthesis
MQTVTVIIPALNEAGNIRRLVGEVRQVSLPGATLVVIVVDNGSSDATPQEAMAAGARLVSEPRRGYGYACAAGAAAAQEGVLVFLDGDGSSAPAEMPRLVEPLLQGRAELVQGSREMGGIDPGAMPPHQRLGNRLAVWLINRLYGVSLSDLGPYRAVRADFLRSLRMGEMTYGWPTEMTVKAARRGARLLEVPVSTHRRRSGRSKVSGTLRGTLLAAWFILGVTLRYAWQKDRPAPPPGED